MRMGTNLRKKIHYKFYGLEESGLLWQKSLTRKENYGWSSPRVHQKDEKIQGQKSLKNSPKVIKAEKPSFIDSISRIFERKKGLKQSRKDGVCGSSYDGLQYSYANGIICSNWKNPAGKLYG
jgi:hypothetical protein